MNGPVRPLTTTDRAAAAPALIQLPWSTRYWYPVTAEPPSSAGGDQVSVTSASPRAAARFRGADGTPRGVASTVATAPGPVPFTARTERIYERALVSPLTKTDREAAAPALIQSPWST